MVVRVRPDGGAQVTVVVYSHRTRVNPTKLWGQFRFCASTAELQAFGLFLSQGNLKQDIAYRQVTSGRECSCALCSNDMKRNVSACDEMSACGACVMAV